MGSGVQLVKPGQIEFASRAGMSAIIFTTHFFARLLVLVFIALPVSVVAQSQETPASSNIEEPSGADRDPSTSYVKAATRSDVSNSDLRQMLRPLRATELSEVTQGWQRTLQENVQQSVDLGLSLKGLDADETANVRKQLIKVKDNRVLILKKYSSVLQAWTRKGASAEETKPYRDYLSALTAEKIHTTDSWTLIEDGVHWSFSKNGGLDFIKRIATILLSILGMRVAAGFLRRMTHKALNGRSGLSRALKNFVPKVVYWGTFVVGLLFLLSGLGFFLGPILTVFGGLSIVVVFAMQEALGNLAAGLMIMVFKPFDFGDYVEVSGTAGIVHEMSLISTTIRTFDNKFIIIPNSKIQGDVITNVNLATTRRVDMVFRIGYEDDVEKAKALLMDLCTGHDKVLNDPPPSVFMAAISDSSVNLNCRPWVLTDDYWTVHWDLIDQGKKAFDAEGISTPLPQQEVHIVERTSPDTQETAELKSKT